jgi:demethylmenaquinone methyltransferase/2-methoxy-6-polyprenyl-1,4-benzoquinol methylase
MANAFYEPGQQRAIRVRALFAAIAPRYDLINDLQSFGLHRLWKHRLLGLAQTKPGDRVLDLCCGTGDVALAFARRGARVTGLDFSPPMLARARARAGNLPIHWVHGDALNLPFAAESFEIVTISYGLRNLADVDLGLKEMLRVSVQGGRLLILEFGKPRQPLWRTCYFGYLRLLVPLYGRLFCGDATAYAYILESLLHYPAQEGVAAVLKSLGCRSVRILNYFGGAMSINYAEKA